MSRVLRKLGIMHEEIVARTDRQMKRQFWVVVAYVDPGVDNVDMDGRDRPLPENLSINLEEDGNQAAFTFINGLEIDSVVIRDVQY
ncbi:hypothetical protein DPMN_137302 [Dreissena polymorpha]|uniref:Uncharacterized protein n=1 Tax=Dreissena polymorpha TaxID=45954 RepID=A0A9D4JEL0_DREPO|nr:hypothetical protein DPMN_137302 [Dreissena polymorpha]